MTLFTPGPVQLSAEVLDALSRPLLHHRSAEFTQLSVTMWQHLQTVFCTTQPVLVVAGSGTTGLEAAMCSTTAESDTIVICSHGRFGERLVQIAHSHGHRVVHHHVAWGSTIDVQEVVDVITNTPSAKALWLVHAETSTGVALPLRDIALAVRSVAPDLLICVDGVTSIGVQEVQTDAWDLDVVVAGSQKGLSAPPGLAAIAVSHRARTAMSGLTVRSHTLNLALVHAAYEDQRWYWTPPVHTVAALTVSLQRIVDQTVQARWQHHEQLSQVLKAGLQKQGLTLYGDATATGVIVVNHPQPKALRDVLRREWDIVVAGGQGTLQHSAFRIGTMGALEMKDIEFFLQSLNASQNLLQGS